MKTTLLTIIVALVSAGCAASIPPTELSSARSAYERANKGPAATYDPTGLHVAREALQTAEQSFDDEGNSQVTRDLSYTALRRIETTEAHARTMAVTAQKDSVVDQMHSMTEAQAQASSEQLGRAKTQLAAKDVAMEAQAVALADAQKRADQAAADLAKFASVKQESRGMVITLSGAVLFTSGKSNLLPAAQVKLNSVAKALTQQDPNSQMVIEGHTDSQGALAFNQQLSEDRANSVRTYLVSRGIAGDRITAEGFGPNRSIGDNATAEGRANNRRVEIVVKPTT